MREIERLLERAQLQIRHRNLPAAVESLRQALTQDPDHAQAHAMLALCLHSQKRLYAAAYEARAALAHGPDSAFVHHAAGVVDIAQRLFKSAEHHLQTALGLDPGNPTSLRTLAQLYQLWNRHREALPLLEKAREADPEDADNWAALAEYYRARREFEQAEQLARHALELEPENTEALLAMGYLLLQRGDTEAAREHALLVLRDDAGLESAIYLLGAVKARRSPLLGLWWRFNAYFGAGSVTRRVVLLIGFSLAYQVALLAVTDLGYPDAASPINYLWLAFCAYTWIGPTLFARQLRRELAPARLDSKY
jgi:Tfp pilus assembly protein PilF